MSISSIYTSIIFPICFTNILFTNLWYVSLYFFSPNDITLYKYSPDLQQMRYVPHQAHSQGFGYIPNINILNLTAHVLQQHLPSNKFQDREAIFSITFIHVFEILIGLPFFVNLQYQDRIAHPYWIASTGGSSTRRAPTAMCVGSARSHFFFG